MITTSRQFADVLSGAPRVASRPRWHQSSNDFLYRNSVPCFFVMMPPPKYSSYTIWQFILEFCRSLMESHPRFFLHIYRTMVWTYRPLNESTRYGAWIAMGCEVASGAADRCLGEKSMAKWPGHPPPWGLCHLALQATTHAGGSSDAGRSRQANTTTSCNTATWKGIRMKETQKWRCLVMLRNNVLDTFR